MFPKKFKKNWHIIKFILILFILWKIAITIITLFGLETIAHTQEPGISNWFSVGNAYITRWANWDGGHYLGIAENGYLPFQVVFFPLYPLLIKGLMTLGMHSFWAGLLIAHTSTIIALFYLYKLTKIDFGEETAKKAAFLFLAFPTSFYLTAVYNESLFLALALAAFYYARAKIWFMAFALASFASVTRLLGLFVILAVTVEYFFPALPKLQLKNFLIKNISFSKFFAWPVIFLVLSFLPFGLYLYYLTSTQANPLIFVQHEKTWGREVISPWETISANLTTFLWEQNLFNGHNAQESIEFIFLVIFIVIFVYSMVKLRLSYNLYYLAALLVPISTGTFEAIHRYALIIFPIFIALSLIKNKYLFNFWLLFSIMFLGLFSVMFINGLWVT